MEKKPSRISPRIVELVMKLKTKNVDVYLVSGGFQRMIKPVAVQLGILPENIFSNQLLFGTSGEYVGFDPAKPTSRSGSKAVAVQHIRQILILTIHSAMLLLISTLLMYLCVCRSVITRHPL